MEKFTNPEEFNTKALGQLFASLKQFNPNYKFEVSKRITKFRPYQDDLIKKINQKFNSKQKHVSIEVGCGLGKTAICGSVSKKHIEQNKKIIVISPNSTAMGNKEQGNINDFYQILGNDVRIGEPNDESKNLDSRNNVFFLTPYRFVTLFRDDINFAKSLFKDVGLVILDEVHRFPEDEDEDTEIIGKITPIVNNELPKANVLTCTATHIRMDGKAPFGKEKPDFKYTIADGIRDGYTPDIYGLPVLIDVEIDGAIKTGDCYKLNFKELKDREKYEQKIVDQFMKLYKNNTKAAHVFFVRSLKEAGRFVEKLNKALGFNGFEVLGCDTPQDERQRIIKDINDGKMIGYVTVNLGSEAVNIPRIEYVHLVVRMTSTIKLVQSVGRGTRLFEGKKCTVIVDYRVMKNNVIKGCLGLWDYAKAGETELDEKDVFIGESLFTRNKIKHNFKDLKYSELEEWITRESIVYELQHCREVFQRAKEKGHLPRKKTSDLQEIKDYNWILVKRQAKKGLGKWRWIPELDIIANEEGYPNLFNDKNNRDEIHCIEIFERAVIKGKLPNNNSKNIQEVKDARWISNKKKAKKKKNWNKIFDEIAKEYGFPNAFNIIDIKQKVIDEFEQIIIRILKSGTIPKKTSKDSQERRDANFISKRKAAKQGLNKSFFCNTLDKMAVDAGYPDLFNNNDRKQKAINELNQIITRIKKNGIIPKHHSENIQEVKDARWIRSKKNAKYKKGENVWYPELQEIAKNAGYPNLFNERSDSEKLKEIIERINKRGEKPKQHSKNVQENLDAKWICRKKYNKKNGVYWNPILDKIAEDAGYPDLFNINDKKIKITNDKIGVSISISGYNHA